MRHAVPYYSQHTHVSRADWKERACTVTCLKMAIEYCTEKETVSIDDLIDEGLLIGAHTQHGWDHAGIAILAHNHGVAAYKEEFRAIEINIQTKEKSKSVHENTLREYGCNKLISHLDQGGVAVVSVLRGMHKDGGFHSVLLIGYEKTGDATTFIYHDPDAKFGSKSNMSIAKHDFLSLWRSMAIFFSKPSIV